MAKVVHVSSYVRDVPSTWEAHLSFHAYMKCIVVSIKSSRLHGPWNILALFPQESRFTR